MKATIGHKTYNTETAELIAEWNNGCFTNDFNYCSEDLMRTPKGAFFIHGRGGANSGYSRSCGNNSYCGGSGITPITEEQALAWCEEHECEEAIEKHFKHLVEDA
jgi:hypothetical protein